MVSKKKTLIASLSGALCMYFLFRGETEIITIPIAYAQAAGVTDTLLEAALSIITLISQGIILIGLYALHILEVLLDPNNFLDFLDFEFALNTLWQVSRDIVNVIFAFLLIAGAVLLIILPHRKEIVAGAIPKFILAIILVNFSWWFPRVILDVASVLTATIYTIPGYVSGVTGITCEKTIAENGDTTCKIWKNPTFNNANWRALEDDGYICPFGKQVCYKHADLLVNANTGQAVLLGLVFNYANLEHFARPPAIGGGARGAAPGPMGPDRVKELVTIVLSMAFQLILLLALFIAIIAMLVAFLIRIPILWLTVAFMPFMFLGWLLGEKMKQFNTMELIWKNFLGAAFLPVIVAVPLSAGFLLLNTGQRMFRGSLGNVNFEQFTTLQNFGFFMQYSTLNLLWLFMCLAVIWIGTFTALKTQKISEGIVQSIQNWGQNIGKLGLTLPLRVPFVPFPAGGVSPMALAKLPSALAQKGRQLDQDSLDKIFGKKPGAAGGATDALKQDIKQEIDVRNNNQLKTDINVAVNRLGEARFTNTDDIVKNLRKGVDNPDTQDFDRQMRKLKDIVQQHGGGALTYEKVKAAAEAAGNTLDISDNLRQGIEEWIRKNV